MKRIIATSGVLVAFLTLLPGGQATGQDSLHLTLNQALKLTYENSPVIKESDYLKKEKELKRKAAWGLHLPQVSLNGNYSFMSDEIHLDLNPVKGAITPLYETLGNYGEFSDVPNPDPQTNDEMPVLPDEQSTQAIRQQMLNTANQLKGQDWKKTIQKDEFATVSARFKWPVFTGGKINAANKAAKIKQDEAQTTGNRKKNQLTTQVIDRYYGVRLAQDAVRIRQQVLDVMNAHLSEAKSMYEEGMIAESQLLHAKVFHAEAQRKLKKARRKLEIAQKALQNTMAIDRAAFIQPTSKLFYRKELRGIEEFREQAVNNSPILRKIELKKKLAHQDYRSKKSDYFPDAAITGMYDVYNKDLSPQLPEWIVGVNLKWNLFDGLARTRKVQAAKFKEKQVEQIHNKTTNDIHTAIDKLYKELELDVEQLQELETSQQYSEEYLRVSRKSFREGMATSTDVTEASVSLSKVKIERLKVMYDYIKKLSRLLELTGESDQFTAYLHDKQSIFETTNE